MSLWAFAQSVVALPTEGVDRNLLRVDEHGRAGVALPTEGVDRNPLWGCAGAKRDVALPTEGVDRNLIHLDQAVPRLKVALPTEGVDRNSSASVYCGAFTPSPSPRRAWIEI